MLSTLTCGKSNEMFQFPPICLNLNFLMLYEATLDSELSIIVPPNDISVDWPSVVKMTFVGILHLVAKAILT